MQQQHEKVRKKRDYTILGNSGYPNQRSLLRNVAPESRVEYRDTNAHNFFPDPLFKEQWYLVSTHPSRKRKRERKRPSGQKEDCQTIIIVINKSFQLLPMKIGWFIIIIRISFLRTRQRGGCRLGEARPSSVIGVGKENTSNSFIVLG